MVWPTSATTSVFGDVLVDSTRTWDGTGSGFGGAPEDFSAWGGCGSLHR